MELGEPVSLREILQTAVGNVYAFVEKPEFGLRFVL
jgi:hypothetical protein